MRRLPDLQAMSEYAYENAPNLYVMAGGGLASSGTVLRLGYLCTAILQDGNGIYVRRGFRIVTRKGDAKTT